LQINTSTTDQVSIEFMDWKIDRFRVDSVESDRNRNLSSRFYTELLTWPFFSSEITGNRMNRPSQLIFCPSLTDSEPPPTPHPSASPFSHFPGFYGFQFLSNSPDFGKIEVDPLLFWVCSNEFS
jgi:hypothetical protein